MILILGGTTEGRLAVRVADAAGSPYWYSTRGDLQQIECKNGTHITGALDEDAMTSFCREHGIRLLVDAAHPFATELHRTVA
ncbi:MAG: precorrin-6A/cobalt-precorrin-6A reductase, partial [Bacteroidales bacterium]|nr:precorrin-6A/cobalt-precorrin-6A reductase [Bacteroidales bacterium]